MRGPSGYDARLQWRRSLGAVAYRIYWGDTWTNDWQHGQNVGDVTDAVLPGVSIDDFVFGVAAIGGDGHESLVSACDVAPRTQTRPGTSSSSEPADSARGGGMAKAIGIGGVFLKSSDPAALREWYRTHLGIDVQEWGGAPFLFNRRDKPGIGYTVWSLFEQATKYFDPSDKPFMVNFRVDDLEGMLADLRARGARVLDRREDAPNGKFGYVVDPEGTLLELWEQSDDDPFVPSE